MSICPTEGAARCPEPGGLYTLGDGSPRTSMGDLLHMNFAERAPATVSNRIIRSIASALRARSIEPLSVLAAVGLADYDHADPDGRVPARLEGALWREAVRRTGDRFFGLNAVHLIQRGDFDVLDYAARTSVTLEESFRRVARYKRLLHDVAELRVVRDGEFVRVLHDWPAESDEARSQFAEYSFAWLVKMGREATGRRWAPAFVQFRHAAPPDTSEPERYFGCEIRYAQTRNGLWIDAETAALPFAKADPGLCALLERYAQENLRKAPRIDDDFVLEVRKALADRLPQVNPAVGAIAAELYLSTRSLQRRLADAGTSFQALVDETRRESCLRLLQEPSIAIAEVAYLTGFSEPSAFYRAFKRWTGATPADYRNQQQRIA